MNLVYIINPNSGKRAKTKDILRLIEDNSTDRFTIYFTEYSGHASILAADSVKKGVDTVVAVGGDGTINEIARSLVNTGVVLGIIPAGSGNGFARSLKIPLNTKKAVQLLNNYSIKTIDAGKLNDKYFFGMCGVGFDALVGATFQNFGKRGAMPYFYIGLKEYFKYNFETFTIVMSGTSVDYDPLLISVANTSQYGNGAVIAPQADPSDGYFDLCIIKKMNAGAALKNISLLFNGKIKQSPYYIHKRVKSLIIKRGNKKGYYHIDGEPFLSDEDLEISVVPSALRVCVPKI